eukprot:scaffold272949_cov14-Prasinocladus_malaysianus.AAC.1
MCCSALRCDGVAPARLPSGCPAKPPALTYSYGGPDRLLGEKHIRLRRCLAHAWPSHYKKEAHAVGGPLDALTTPLALNRALQNNG